MQRMEIELHREYISTVSHRIEQSVLWYFCVQHKV